MELDERKKLGVFSDGKSDENVKTSHDLNISLLDDWKREDETFTNHYQCILKRTWIQ